MKANVKICGLTRLEDARAAVAAGADFLGFVCVPDSPRFVTAQEVAAITRAVPPRVQTVAVFVNAAEGDIRETLEAGRIDWIQLHGDETPECARSLGPERIWRVVHLAVESDAQAICGYPCAAVVADTAAGGARGGTGIVGDWAVAAKLASRKKLVLAGGLTPDNVADAVRSVRPWCVDVSSGVEAQKRIKDAGEMRRFVQAARSV